MNIELSKSNDVNFFGEYRSVLEKLLNDLEAFSDPDISWVKSEFKTALGSFELFTRSKDQYVNLIDVTDRFISQLFSEEKAEEFIDRVIEEASNFHNFDISDTGRAINHVIDWMKGVRNQELVA